MKEFNFWCKENTEVYKFSPGYKLSPCRGDNL